MNVDSFIISIKLDVFPWICPADPQQVMHRYPRRKTRNLSYHLIQRRACAPINRNQPTENYHYRPHKVNCDFLHNITNY